MTDGFDLLLTGAMAVTPAGVARADLGVRAGRIAAIGTLAGAKAERVMDLAGLTILPGVIDSQVHLREPGLEYKEDLATGTAAAALGGVTAVCEMPNTKPSTLTAEAIADKLARAHGRAWTDHAFFIGAAVENIPQLAALERLPGCAGVKVFMGSSTGSLLVDGEDALAGVLASGFRRVAVHCEDEARLKERFALVADGAEPEMHPEWRDARTAFLATERLLRLARAAGRRVHVLHVTTAEEMELLARNKDLATVEVTPQHLTLSAPDCYRRLGTLAQMNPPVRGEEHRQALWRAVEQGVVDVIGSDHAPHTREEKARPYPQSPSGMTGVQTLVPVMLDHVAAGRLSLERFVDLTSAGPARTYGMAGKGRIAVGYDADFTVVDLKARRKISHLWIASKCGWTPYDGMKVTGWPIATIIRGSVVMQDDELQGDPQGQPLRFGESLPRG
ncbi:dihydroorotase [mine drainage metagenome]|uniref:Dihydroorotase n=1 Tax=mine drainage metagenome TaxID=410659 RepID=A0A1J5RJ09_9ZZZZ